MSSWRVSAEGVAGVIAAVDAEVRSLDEFVAVDRLPLVLDGLSWGGQYAAVVADAVRAAVESQAKRVDGARGQVVAARTGVVEATNTYTAAGQEMAAGTQARAAAAVGSVDLAWFGRSAGW